MSESSPPLKILFVVNPQSGKTDIDWLQIITDHFAEETATAEILELEKDCDPEVISKKIDEFKPQRVIAVGGDGTVKLVAEQILDKPEISLGILPAGSANGMAKELNIPVKPEDALKLCYDGVPQKIHLIKVNDEICIHLSDVGFNAFVIKMFESQEGRGMWGYVKASWKALWQHDKLDVKI
ncbi:MAG: diacylglycerol kinase family lipid kinase, partial [Chitinophagaceae bacterium]